MWLGSERYPLLADAEPDWATEIAARSRLQRRKPLNQLLFLPPNAKGRPCPRQKTNTGASLAGVFIHWSRWPGCERTRRESHSGTVLVSESMHRLRFARVRDQRSDSLCAPPLRSTGRLSPLDHDTL